MSRTNDRAELTKHLLESYIIEAIRSKHGVKSEQFGKKFDLKKFKELEGIHIILKYANTFLDSIGIGSSRQAFTLSSKYVLKVAINEKGLAQNQAELDVYTNPKSKPIVAKIYEADLKNQWLISDLVKPITEITEFKSLTGIEWADFKAKISSLGTHTQEINDNDPDMIKAAMQTALDNNLKRGDLAEINHWGKTPDGRVVLLDYGFTKEVYDTHYKKKNVGSNDPTNKPSSKVNPLAKTKLAGGKTELAPDDESTKKVLQKPLQTTRVDNDETTKPAKKRVHDSIERAIALILSEDVDLDPFGPAMYILKRVENGDYHMLPTKDMSPKERAAAQSLEKKGILARKPATSRFPERYVVTATGSHVLGTFAHSNV